MINEWTDDMQRRFTELHGQTPELSFTAMAVLMSAEFQITLTRNACIGKARRMGLTMRGPRGDSRRIPGKPKKGRKMKVRVDAPIVPVEAQIPEQLPPSGLTILQLRDGVCHWPLGPMHARPPYDYCGCRARPGMSYCTEHSRRAYNAPKERWA